MGIIGRMSGAYAPRGIERGKGDAVLLRTAPPHCFINKMVMRLKVHQSTTRFATRQPFWPCTKYMVYFDG